MNLLAAALMSGWVDVVTLMVGVVVVFVVE